MQNPWEDDDGLTPEDRLTNLFFEKLYGAIGHCLCVWQSVERAHFSLFVKMLDSSNWETAAAAYYSIESFAQRHKMVSNVAHYFLKDQRYKSARKEWINNSSDGGLQKVIGDANLNRNKLAHYGVDFEAIRTRHGADGAETVTDDLDSFRMQIRFPVLRPVAENLVERLIGRTGDKPEYSLSIGKIEKYAEQFHHLAMRMRRFEISLIEAQEQRESSPEPKSPHPTDQRPQ